MLTIVGLYLGLSVASLIRSVSGPALSFSLDGKPVDWLNQISTTFEALAWAYLFTLAVKALERVVSR